MESRTHVIFRGFPPHNASITKSVSLLINTIAMKLTSTAVLLALAASVHCSQIVLDNVLGTNRPADADQQQQYSGFSLNLDEQRLIQLNPSEPPVVLTEFQKVLYSAFSEALILTIPQIKLKSLGIKFLDM